MTQDVVCGATIDDQVGAESNGLFCDLEGKRFWFCGTACKQTFESRPTAYTLAEEEWQASTDGMPEPYQLPPNIT